MFNPTPKDVLIGFITYDVEWEGTVQKISKLRVDCIEGNINSSLRVINNPYRLKAINYHNELFVAVAEVSAET